MKKTSFLGLRTVIYPVPDRDAARDWYARVLGVDAYFDQPFYVGFNVGGFELGLDPNGAKPSEGGAVAYWGVESAAAEHDRLVSLGAVSVSAVADVGEGILVATLRDPFGNLIGIIQNPHFPNEA